MHGRFRCASRCDRSRHDERATRSPRESMELEFVSPIIVALEVSRGLRDSVALRAA